MAVTNGAKSPGGGARADEDDLPGVMSPNESPAPGGLKSRILFVDDEAILREHLARVLSDDYRVDTAGNGTEALRAVLRAKPDLIVTDIVMPDMDGVELLRILRGTPSTQGIPVLLISGQAADEQRIEGLREGADGYLAKPYTERELRALIGSMLHAAQLRAEIAGREAREQAERRALIERATLLESITDAFYALDAQWRFTYVNQHAIDFFGKARGDLLGQECWEVFPELRDSVLQEHHERALRERCSVSFEALLPLSARWLDVRAYPTPQGLAVHFSDISQRKHTEQELECALARLRAREEQLRENEHQLTCEVDAMRRLHTLVNRLLGCNDLQTALEEVLDAAMSLLNADMGNIQLIDSKTQQLQIAAHRGFGEEFLAYFKNLGADPSTVCARGVQRRRTVIVEDVETDAEFAPHRAIAASAGFRAVQSTPVTSRKGETLGVLATHFRTPHRPTERELRMIELYARQAAEFIERIRSEESLKEAARRKTEFLAILAHELRNPLAPIRTGVQILQLRAVADEVSRRTASMMDRQMTHLVHLVDDLLDVSRITQGRLALQCQKVSLTEVLAIAVEASRTLIESHAHHLVLDIRPTKPMIVDGDRHRLTQIFSNLLSNSAKYTDRGGTITLTLDCEEANAVVSVRDTGIGIAPDHLERVFEMFSQIRPEEARSDGGLGIGLSLVRTLIQMHGGSVSAASDGVGKGSTFTVRLPLAKNATTSVSEPVGPVCLSPEGRPQRVLVVDDNADAAASLGELLQMSGHEVHTASDGTEAIERVRQLRPTLVFMDIGMPGMDGVEAALRIRALPFGHDIRIIALTGWGQDADRQRTRSAGMDHHLVKPVSIDALQDVLDRVNRQECAVGNPHPH